MQYINLSSCERSGDEVFPFLSSDDFIVILMKSCDSKLRRGQNLPATSSQRRGTEVSIDEKVWELSQARSPSLDLVRSFPGLLHLTIS